MLGATPLNDMSELQTLDYELPELVEDVLWLLIDCFDTRDGIARTLHRRDSSVSAAINSSIDRGWIIRAFKRFHITNKGRGFLGIGPRKRSEEELEYERSTRNFYPPRTMSEEVAESLCSFPWVSSSKEELIQERLDAYEKEIQSTVLSWRMCVPNRY